MRTTTYSTEKEISVGIMIVVFTLAIFTTVKVKELQVNGANNYEEMKTDRTEIYYHSFPLAPVADAKLIDEPLKETETGLSITNENMVDQWQLFCSYERIKIVRFRTIIV